MSISEPFIRRPVATSLLAAALFLAGMAAYTQLPIAPLPRVDFPTIQVSASLPGGSPQTMAATVATPLERRFGRIAGVSEITSASSLGTTQVTLQFELDRDVDAAARDVQAAINAAGGDLPANLPFRPNLRKVNPADSAILVLALTSDTIPLAKVFDAANAVLAQKISQLEGVGQVFVGGGQQPAVRVQADPVALAGVGLSLEDVRSLLAQTTVDQPKGSLTGPAQARTLAANDQLLDPADYPSLILSQKAGAAVRLGDVATVLDSVENSRVAGWYNGRRAVVVVIRRQPGANIIDVIDRIKRLLPQLSQSISPAIRVNIAIDRGGNITSAVHDVQFTLALSVVLVVCVVFLFLRSARATAIPSVAVPLSIAATFALMYLLDYSLDNLSLMALTISTGFVVDDAIVVTENVTRYIEAGESGFQAALKGARQIGFTIVSITGSLLAVFIPLLLMGGIVGRLFREFAVTLCIAIAVSAIISLTLTPMMCARLLQAEAKASQGRLNRALEGAFDRLVRLYDRGLVWVLAHRHLMLGVTLGTIALTVYLYGVVPKGLFPQQDTGQLSGFADAPQDISFPGMRTGMEALNRILQQSIDVADFVSFTGGATTNSGNFFIQLKPNGPRKLTADQVAAALRPRLSVGGVHLYLQSIQDVRVGGRVTRTQYQYTLEDANLDELNTWAPRVLERLSSLPQLRDVASDQQTAGLQLDLDIDRDTASRLGITPQMIDDTLYDAYGQRQVATLFTELNQYRVVLEVKPELQATPDALEHIYVKPPSGQPVPLSALVHVHTSTTSLSINHQGQFPAVTLSFNVASGASLGDAVVAIDRAEREIGLPSSVHPQFQGTAQAFQESLASEPYLILAALITVYIVLGVLYESFVHPITILSTLPSAGVGALLALLAVHAELSIMALIGIILLIGIVKKNAIMMIDFALEAEREQGLSPADAIRQACLLRFRPILMTTLAALFGGLPLALGHGAGSELRQPLGVTIVGGLIFSQLLTLFTTPVIYLAMDFFRRRPAARAVAQVA